MYKYRFIERKLKIKIDENILKYRRYHSLLLHFLYIYNYYIPSNKV